MCISGPKIIYIQVAYFPAPVARSHSTPTCSNTTTHKSAIQTPGLCSVFVYNPHSGFNTKVIISSYTFACSQLPCSLFILACPTRTGDVCHLQIYLFHMNSLNVALPHFLSVNITSKLLVKPWKVSVCLPCKTLSFLCESDTQMLTEWSLRKC